MPDISDDDKDDFNQLDSNEGSADALGDGSQDKKKKKKRKEKKAKKDKKDKKKKKHRKNEEAGLDEPMLGLESELAEDHEPAADAQAEGQPEPVVGQKRLRKLSKLEDEAIIESKEELVDEAAEDVDKKGGLPQKRRKISDDDEF